MKATGSLLFLEKEQEAKKFGQRLRRQAGFARPRPKTGPWPVNGGVPPVPEIQGKAKHTKEKAPPIIAGTSGPELKVYHAMPPQPDDEDERSVP